YKADLPQPVVDVRVQQQLHLLLKGAVGRAHPLRYQLADYLLLFGASDAACRADDVGNRMDDRIDLELMIRGIRDAVFLNQRAEVLHVLPLLTCESALRFGAILVQRLLDRFFERDQLRDSGVAFDDLLEIFADGLVAWNGQRNDRI